jgi:hypothetical protein
MESELEEILSEPIIGWFCAQFLYCFQPILTAFWGDDQILRLAERFTGEKPPPPGTQPAPDTR